MTHIIEIQGFAELQHQIEQLSRKIDLLIEDRPGTNDVLTVQEAAAVMRVSQDTMRRYGRDGKVPMQRRGKKMLFLRSDLVQAGGKVFS